MAILLFSNNATTTIAGAISTTATSVNLAAGTGALFPQPTAGQYFVATFTDQATGLINEIVWVTAITGDTATIQRAKEGTVAQNWNVNDDFGNLWTAGQAAAMVQQDQLSSNGTFYGTDAGTANAAVITVSPVPTGYVNGSVYIVKKANSANTGAMTANVATLGNVPVVNPDGTALTAGQWPASSRAQMAYDSATGSLCLIGIFPTAASNGGLSFTAEGVGSLNFGNLAAPVGAMTLTDILAVTSTNDAKIVQQTLAAIIGAIGSLLGMSLGASGYITLPGPTGQRPIIQWITGTTDPADNTFFSRTVSWPLTFPNACLGAVISYSSATASGLTDIDYKFIGAPGTSSLTYFRDLQPNGTNSFTSYPFMIGVGY